MTDLKIDLSGAIPTIASTGVNVELLTPVGLPSIPVSRARLNVEYLHINVIFVGCPCRRLAHSIVFSLHLSLFFSLSLSPSLLLFTRVIPCHAQLAIMVSYAKKTHGLSEE